MKVRAQEPGGRSAIVFYAEMCGGHAREPRIAGKKDPIEVFQDRVISARDPTGHVNARFAPPIVSLCV
eukprot:SAG11_NODE_37124_length_258_cov_0.924528_1_plen_67_part_10